MPNRLSVLVRTAEYQQQLAHVAFGSTADYQQQLAHWLFGHITDYQQQLAHWLFGPIADYQQQLALFCVRIVAQRPSNATEMLRCITQLSQYNSEIVQK